MAKSVLGARELERCARGPYDEIALLALPRKSITRGNFCPWLTGSLYRKILIPQYTADRKFLQKELNSSAYLEAGRRWEAIDSS